MPVRIVSCIYICCLLAGGIPAALIKFELPFQFASLLINLLFASLRVNIWDSQFWVFVGTNPLPKFVSLNQLTAHRCSHRRIKLSVNNLHSTVNLNLRLLFKSLDFLWVSNLFVNNLIVKFCALLEYTIIKISDYVLQCFVKSVKRTNIWRETKHISNGCYKASEPSLCDRHLCGDSSPCRVC